MEASPPKTNELVLLVGLPGAGKTTFFGDRFAKTHTHLSKDKLGRKGSKEVKLQNLLTIALGNRESVVIDSCNVRKDHRANLISTAGFFGVPVHCYVFKVSSIEECYRRNAQRTGKSLVPEFAIRARRNEYIEPRWDEGFERMFYVRVVEATRTFVVTEQRR